MGGPASGTVGQPDTTATLPDTTSQGQGQSPKIQGDSRLCQVVSTVGLRPTTRTHAAFRLTFGVLAVTKERMADWMAPGSVAHTSTMRDSSVATAPVSAPVFFLEVTFTLDVKAKTSGGSNPCRVTECQSMRAGAGWCRPAAFQAIPANPSTVHPRRHPCPTFEREIAA